MVRLDLTKELESESIGSIYKAALENKVGVSIL
jgi:hypothetical protein